MFSPRLRRPRDFDLRGDFDWRRDRAGAAFGSSDFEMSGGWKAAGGLAEEQAMSTHDEKVTLRHVPVHSPFTPARLNSKPEFVQPICGGHRAPAGR
jgi:hypothetical protein